MPSDVWMEEGQDTIDNRSAIALTRPPDPSDWKRFLANAAFVTSFKRFGLAPDLDDDTYRTICLYRPGPGPLLPNLHELVWEEADADVFEYGYQFLGPKLTTLHIGQPPSDTLLLPILRSLHVKCPQIRHLSVQCRSSVGPVDPIVSRAVKQLLHLETIDLSLPLFDDALEHLATLPNLTVAKLFLPRDTELHERLTTIPAPIFPRLTILHVSVIRLEPSLTYLVDLISSCQLSDVRLSAAHDPSSVSLNSFLTALSRCPSSDVLSAVNLSFPMSSSIPLMRSLNAVPPHDHPECTLDISTFKPILSGPELTDLDVTSFFLRLDDEFIRTLAAACPRLQSLRLVPPYYSGRLPEVTLDGLLPLFRSCSDLESLSLPINATEAPSDFTGCMHDSQLLTLDVGDSPIRFADEVAAFLSAHCTHPSFEIIAAQALEGDSNPEHIRMRELHCVMWNQVARLVRLFAKVRSQEREHWMGRGSNP
ncbi:hypothetical protein DICSQDRAFT_142974 [Dichomitus squalens LYAD-421 SS1]|uniref:uncharacterized protein n=1 Tax=Dichomitus squalens (strain LYAD-421) TaxID=732165 RepID=UPI0004414391|nr:uncharacterized protein DICSQDRAFT_142974 [Dichomitus squalens LYAD-421 SS1]EJF67445.1 hypothetical protein DICSQDRAFT_142974 [Dichomitus squalens LYAD-421 SS1]